MGEAVLRCRDIRALSVFGLLYDLRVLVDIVAPQAQATHTRVIERKDPAFVMGVSAGAQMYGTTVKARP